MTMLSTWSSLCLVLYLSTPAAAAPLAGPSLPGSWQAWGSLPPAQKSLRGLAVDDAGYIYAGRYTVGVFRSDSPDGQTFSPIAAGDMPATESVRLIHGNGQGSVVAATLSVGSTIHLYTYSAASNSWVRSLMPAPPPSTIDVDNIAVDGAGTILVTGIYTSLIYYSVDGGKSFHTVDVGSADKAYLGNPGFNTGGILSVGAAGNGRYYVSGELSPTTGVAASFAQLVAGQIDFAPYDPAAGCVSDPTSFCHAGDKFGANVTRSGEVLVSVSNVIKVVRIDDGGAIHRGDKIAGKSGVPDMQYLLNTNRGSTWSKNITTMPLTTYGYNFFVSPDGIYATDGVPDAAGEITWFEHAAGMPAGYAASMDVNEVATGPSGHVYVAFSDGQIWRYGSPSSTPAPDAGVPMADASPPPADAGPPPDAAPPDGRADGAVAPPDAAAAGHDASPDAAAPAADAHQPDAAGMADASMSMAPDAMTLDAPPVMTPDGPLGLDASVLDARSIADGAPTDAPMTASDASAVAADGGLPVSPDGAPTVDGPIGTQQRDASAATSEDRTAGGCAVPGRGARPGGLVVLLVFLLLRLGARPAGAGAGAGASRWLSGRRFSTVSWRARRRISVMEHNDP